eukprot:3467170-Pleurochrysis_carterae.AAC.2
MFACCSVRQEGCTLFVDDSNLESSVMFEEGSRHFTQNEVTSYVNSESVRVLYFPFLPDKTWQLGHVIARGVGLAALSASAGLAALLRAGAQAALAALNAQRTHMLTIF